MKNKLTAIIEERDWELKRNEKKIGLSRLVPIPVLVFKIFKQRFRFRFRFLYFQRGSVPEPVVIGTAPTPAAVAACWNDSAWHSYISIFEDSFIKLKPYDFAEKSKIVI